MLLCSLEPSRCPAVAVLEWIQLSLQASWRHFISLQPANAQPCLCICQSLCGCTQPCGVLQRKTKDCITLPSFKLYSPRLSNTCDLLMRSKAPWWEHVSTPTCLCSVWDYCLNLNLIYSGNKQGRCCLTNIDEWIPSDVMFDWMSTKISLLTTASKDGASTAVLLKLDLEESLDLHIEWLHRICHCFVVFF